MQASTITLPITAFLAAITISSHVLAAPSAISFDFDGDGIPDRISYLGESGNLVVNYQSSSLGTKKQYSQKKFDECSSMGLYRIPGTSQIAIDGSCLSQGGQIYIHIYEWSKTDSDWCLVREITGEKPDFHTQDFVGSRHVSTVSGCPHIGDDGPYNYAPESTVTKRINQLFARLEIASKSSAEIKQYIQTIPFYEPLEISEHLTKENVESANNLAFYLSQNRRSYDALQLLQAIVRNFPDRVVAKLNLADAFWANDTLEPAKEMYASYVAQMKSLGKANLIPSWATDRCRAVKSSH